MKRRDVLRYLGATGTSLYLGAQFTRECVKAASPASQDDGVFLNQIGYQPSATKQATVRSATTDRDFRVRRANDNKVVYSGTLTPAMHDEASGDLTSLADFTGVHAAGTYRLETGTLVSDPFAIDPRAYADALRVTMRGFSGQRCGCAVDLGDGYKHALCHADGAFHPTSGKAGTLPNLGGWHDAGDYGRYIVNSGISTGTLLWAWELYPQAVRSLHLAIPESGGKTPDYLAEIRWNLNWMLTLQDGDGGVWHKQTSEHFCAFIMPEADTLTSYVIGTGSAPYKSTCATADLASVMAIAARCYAPYDDAFARRCLAAAKKAWAWAMAHPDVTFQNPPSVKTGDYGDQHCSDELAWASAELWRTTGDAQYEQAFLKLLPAGDALTITEPGWSNVLPMACWTYALADRTGDQAAKSRIIEATATAAAALLARSGENGYGNTLVLRDYVWGSNSAAGNQSLLLLLATHFHANGDYQQAALGNLHYLLGRNCHGVSWVTHLGVRPFQHPHHRPSVADGIEAPWPGLLSGGPNAHGGDAVADAMPKAPPMRMWLDDDRAYSMNEIAINWNAPLVFLLAAANA